MNKKRIFLLCSLVVLTIASIMVGVAQVNTVDILKFNMETWEILLETRLPRTITVIIAAASISISGLIIQNINRNKYISPSTMGTTAGTQIGLLALYVFFGNRGHLVRFSWGFIFAMLTSWLFVLLVKNNKAKESIYTPIMGIMYTGILSSLGTFISFKADVSQWYQGLNIGTFSHVISYNYYYIYMAVPALIIAYLYAVKFTAVGMGEEFSRNIGVNYSAVMLLGLVIVAVISSVSYIVVGSIPLFGLIIPNIVSVYYGDNLKKTIGDVAVLGAVMLLACDILARLVVYPFEVPISIVTSIVGSAVFIFMILRRKI